MTDFEKIVEILKNNFPENNSLANEKAARDIVRFIIDENPLSEFMKNNEPFNKSEELIDLNVPSKIINIYL